MRKTLLLGAAAIIDYQMRFKCSLKFLSVNSDSCSWYACNHSYQIGHTRLISLQEHSDLPDVINCQFREFAVAPLGSVHFLSPDQQSGIHCLIICTIQYSC